jgi:lysophospholipase L1-like esterase
MAILAAAGSLASVGTAAAQQPAELVPYSVACTVPDATLASIAPLPHLADTLKKRKVVRVLVVGQSASPGYGPSTQPRRFPENLEEILERALKGLDVEFINRGVSGEMAAASGERIRNEVALLDPDIVLWQVGTNDAMQRAPVAEFEETVTATLHWLKERGKDPVLVGLQYTKGLARDDHYRAIKDALARAAQRANVLLVRRYEAMQFIAQASKEKDLIARDEFYLNDLGYRCAAEHIARAIVLSVFSRRDSDAGDGKVTTGQLAPPAK